MRIITMWIVGLAALTSACSSVNTKPDSDIAIRSKYGSHAYWFTTTQGCRVADENATDDLTYEWNGRCESGLVTGCGQLLGRLKISATIIKKMDGCFSEGLKNGEIHLAIGQNVKWKIEYVKGESGKYTQVLPSPPPVPEQLPDAPKTTGRRMRGG